MKGASSFLTAVLVGAVVILGFLYLSSSQELSTLKSNPQYKMDQQAKEYLSSIEKLILLPQGETPNIAVVTNPDQLKDKAFFQNVKKDHVLVTYPKALKAVIYDPTENKIINYGSIQIEPQKASPKKK